MIGNNPKLNHTSFKSHLTSHVTPHHNCGGVATSHGWSSLKLEAYCGDAICTAVSPPL